MIRKLIENFPNLHRHARLWTRRFRAHTNGYPNFKKIHQNDFSPAQTSPLSRVLLATTMGGYLPGATLEGLLGMALRLRGAEIHVLLCDKILSACQECELAWWKDDTEFATEGPQKLCSSCFSPAKKFYEGLGFRVHRLSEYISSEEHRWIDDLSSKINFDEIKSFTWEGLAIGEHSLAGALRFYAVAELENELQRERVARRYFKAALLTAIATRNLIKKFQFHVSVFHHGIYVPQGLVAEALRRKGVRVVNWNPGYRNQSFIFSHHETYHHTLMSEPVSTWEQLPWSDEVESALMNYLKSRWTGSQDWIWFHERPQFDAETLKTEIGIDVKTRPTIGILTSVMWDAQLHYPANAFANMKEWVLETIKYFETRPDIQLLIRIHPAEISGTLRSRQPILAEIIKVFPRLPSNVFVIPPESNLSTYVAMSTCNAVVIYGTKTGVELSAMGIPVIVAGEAWIRNKGITKDATSAGDYFQLLNELPYSKGMSIAEIARAKRYAFHFFFRRMIPLDIAISLKGKWPGFSFRIDRLSQIEAGACKGLDVICDGIINGSPFIYPAENEYGVTGHG